MGVWGVRGDAKGFRRRDGHGGAVQGGAASTGPPARSTAGAAPVRLPTCPSPAAPRPPPPLPDPEERPRELYTVQANVSNLRREWKRIGGVRQGSPVARCVAGGARPQFAGARACTPRRRRAGPRRARSCRGTVRSHVRVGIREGVRPPKSPRPPAGSGAGPPAAPAPAPAARKAARPPHDWRRGFEAERRATCERRCSRPGGAIPAPHAWSLAVPLAREAAAAARRLAGGDPPVLCNISIARATRPPHRGARHGNAGGARRRRGRARAQLRAAAPGSRGWQAASSERWSCPQGQLRTPLT
jgi:hypothetical protein